MVPLIQHVRDEEPPDDGKSAENGNKLPLLRLISSYDSIDKDVRGEPKDLATPA